MLPQGLLYSSYKEKNWMYNPKRPMSIQISPYVLGCYSLSNASFLECASCVSPATTSIPTNSHISWNHLHLFNFSVSQWCIGTSSTILKYERIFSDVRPHSNKSSTKIFEVIFLSSCSFVNMSHFFCRIIIIDTNVGAAFNAPKGITLHHWFMSGVETSSLYRASYYATTCQYPLSMSTTIKYFSYVSMPCTN